MRRSGVLNSPWILPAVRPSLIYRNRRPFPIGCSAINTYALAKRSMLSTGWVNCYKTRQSKRQKFITGLKCYKVRINRVLTSVIWKSFHYWHFLSDLNNFTGFTMHFCKQYWCCNIIPSLIIEIRLKLCIYLFNQNPVCQTVTR